MLDGHATLVTSGRRSAAAWPAAGRVQQHQPKKVGMTRAIRSRPAVSPDPGHPRPAIERRIVEVHRLHLGEGDDRHPPPSRQAEGDPVSTPSPALDRRSAASTAQPTRAANGEAPEPEVDEARNREFEMKISAPFSWRRNAAVPAGASRNPKVVAGRTSPTRAGSSSRRRMGPARGPLAFLPPSPSSWGQAGDFTRTGPGRRGAGAAQRRRSTPGCGAPAGGRTRVQRPCSSVTCPGSRVRRNPQAD
jgi:hypothetical protein